MCHSQQPAQRGRGQGGTESRRGRGGGQRSGLPPPPRAAPPLGQLCTTHLKADGHKRAQFLSSGGCVLLAPPLPGPQSTLAASRAALASLPIYRSKGCTREHAGAAPCCVPLRAAALRCASATPAPAAPPREFSAHLYGSRSRSRGKTSTCSGSGWDSGMSIQPEPTEPAAAAPAGSLVRTSPRPPAPRPLLRRCRSARCCGGLQAVAVGKESEL